MFVVFGYLKILFLALKLDRIRPRVQTDSCSHRKNKQFINNTE